MFSIKPISLDLLDFHRLNPERYPFLLESVAHGTQQSRFDVLFAFPQQALRLHSDGTLEKEGHEIISGFLDQLQEWFQREKTPELTDPDVPFTGGWFTYLGYELVQEIEPGLKLPQTTVPETIACAVRCPAAIMRDHEQNRLIIFVEDQYEHLLADMEKDLLQVQSIDSHEQVEQPKPVSICEDEGSIYEQSVERIRQYIVEGDVFQVNLSRKWELELEQDIADSDVYAALRDSNPAPFAALAVLPDFSIISSSPERLVSVHDRLAETRPIAGTRPRSGEQQEDKRLSEELLAHPKEQAEHIMLIDLERNDLGRVCVPGTVRTNEMMVLESYAHVHHIVSNVQGELRDDCSPVDVIRAVFPGGTITGCPKVRCMEIIAELENDTRGAYTGSIGYINRDGSMDLNILIRTLVKNKRHIRFRTGAGIVYDSRPQHELEETRAKAKGLLKAFTIENNSTD